MELKLKLRLLRDTLYRAARFARRRTRILAPFIVAVSVIAIFGALELNPGNHRTGLIRLAERRLNAKVGIGRICPLFYPRPGIEFTDVRIYLPDPQRLRPELIRAKSVKLILDVRDLRSLHFFEIDLAEPEIYLELSPDETQRLAHLFKPGGKVQDQAAAEFKPSRPSKIWNLIRRKFPSGFNLNDLLKTERIFISKAGATIYDRRDPTRPLRAPLRFRNLDLHLTKAAADNTFDFRLSGEHPSGQAGLEPLAITGKGKMFLTFKPFDWKFKFDEANWGDNPFQQLEMEIAKIDTKPIFQCSARARMDLTDAMQNMRWDPIKYFPWQERIQASGKSEISFELTYPGKGIGLSYQGTAHLQDATIDWGKFIFPMENINTDVKLVRGELSIPTSEMHISGMPFHCGFVLEFGASDGRPLLKINCDISGSDLDKVFVRISHALALKNQPGTKKGPRKAIWSGEFTGTNVKYKQFVSDQVISSMRFKDHILDFPGLILKYQEGSFKDAGSWFDIGLYRIARFHLRGWLKNFKFNPAFAQAFRSQLSLDGKANGQGYLSLDLLDGKVTISSLNGYFRLLVNGGKIIGANPFFKVLQAIGFKGEHSKSGLQFDSLSSNLVVKDGVLYSDDIKLKNSYLQARAAGQIDINRQTVKLWAAIYVLQSFTTTRAIPLEEETVSAIKPVLLEGASAELFQPPTGPREKGKVSITAYYVKIEGPWKAIKIKNYDPHTENAPRAPAPVRFQNMPQIYK